MRIGVPIEVSGIERILIDRKHEWLRFGAAWGYQTPKHSHTKTTEQMSHYIKALTKTHRLWVHNDTLNVVRKDYAR